MVDVATAAASVWAEARVAMAVVLVAAAAVEMDVVVMVVEVAMVVTAAAAEAMVVEAEVTGSGATSLHKPDMPCICSVDSCALHTHRDRAGSLSSRGDGALVASEFGHGSALGSIIVEAPW